MKILANGSVFHFYGCRKNQAHWWMMMMMIHFPGRSLASDILTCVYQISFKCYL